MASQVGLEVNGEGVKLSDPGGFTIHVLRMREEKGLPSMAIFILLEHSI